MTEEEMTMLVMLLRKLYTTVPQEDQLHAEGIASTLELVNDRLTRRD
jgi:hypothetical protein